MIIDNYTFNAATGQITFTDYTSIRIEGVKIITNVVDGIMIYQFNDSSLLGTVAGNVLTLAFDTSLMSNSDQLMIIYDDITLATPEATLLVLNDLVQALKQIRQTLNPLSTQDSTQRQRVVVESLTGANTILGATNITHTNTIVAGNSAPTVGTYTFQPVWEGPVEQRWRVMDDARTLAYVQRQNLTFS